jgi:hypothetical protein
VLMSSYGAGGSWSEGSRDLRVCWSALVLGCSGLLQRVVRGGSSFSLTLNSYDVIVIRICHSAY